MECGSAHHQMFGSSPRAWGTVSFKIDREKIWRFIPTCVGNGFMIALCGSFLSVHPHVRGERRTLDGQGRAIRGSSPRAWGTDRRRRVCFKCARFIPTCVGNGPLPGTPTNPNPVHPHVRGERTRSQVCTSSGAGSSPRAWGTAGSPRHPLDQGRFIPTCVGNGSWPSWPGRGSAVHPHVRGERRTSSSGRGGVCGSSPRAWGTVLPMQPWLAWIRFIPTCVGNGPGQSGGW